MSPVTLATTLTPTPLCGHLSHGALQGPSARGRGEPARGAPAGEAGEPPRASSPRLPPPRAARPRAHCREPARSREHGGGSYAVPLAAQVEAPRGARPGTPPAADLAQPLSAANPVPGEPARSGLVAVPGRAVQCRDAPGSDPRLRSVAS